MPTNAQPQVTTPTDREIVLTRVFEAPRALVFEAYTRPELLAYWVAGPGWTLAACEVDLKVGGTSRLVMRGPAGAERTVRGQLREVVRPERLVTAEVVDAADAAVANERVVTTNFADAGPHTRVQTTLLFPSKQARDALLDSGALGALSASLDTLGTLLAAVDSFPEAELAPAPAAPEDPAEIEASLCRLIAEQLGALCARDLDRLMAPYAPEVVVFTHAPPAQLLGLEPLRAHWAAALAALPDAPRPEVRDLRLTHSDDLASAHWLYRVVAPTAADPDPAWTRTTATFRRVLGRWRVVHEHRSPAATP